jgi:hypothetical protein
MVIRATHAAAASRWSVRPNRSGVPTSSHSAYRCHCPAWHLAVPTSTAVCVGGGWGEYSGGFGPLRPAARCLGRDHSKPADGAAAEAVRAPERTLAARSMWLVRLQG